MVGPDKSQHEGSAFYGATVAGLRALYARKSTPRRFGADAEARWWRLSRTYRDASVNEQDWGSPGEPQ